MRGFANVEKQLGLTMEHYELVLRKLAKWHAANAVLKEKVFIFCPDFYNDILINLHSILYTAPKHFEHLKTFGSHPMNEDVFNETMTSNIIRVLADVTKKMPGFEILSTKLPKSAETMHARMAELVKPDEQSCFVTLCHGDLWSNNIMFSTDTNKCPTDAVFCDYQISFIGPAVIDVANTLYTSSHLSLRADDYDRLAQIYHEELIETLSKFGHLKSLPTLTDIQVELLRCGVCHVAIGLFVCAARSYEKFGEMDNMSKLAGDNDVGRRFIYDVLISAKENEAFKFLLNYFDRRGYFD